MADEAHPVVPHELPEGNHGRREEHEGRSTPEKASCGKQTSTRAVHRRRPLRTAMIQAVRLTSGGLARLMAPLVIPALCLGGLGQIFGIDLLNARTWLRIATLDIWPSYPREVGWDSIGPAAGWLWRTLYDAASRALAAGEVPPDVLAWPKIDTLDEAKMAAYLVVCLYLSLIANRRIRARLARICGRATQGVKRRRSRWLAARNARWTDGEGLLSEGMASGQAAEGVARRALPGQEGLDPQTTPFGQPMDAVSELTDIAQTCGWHVHDPYTVARLLNEAPAGVDVIAIQVDIANVWLIAAIAFPPAPGLPDTDPQRAQWLSLAQEIACDASSHLLRLAARFQDLVEDALDLTAGSMVVETMLIYAVQPGRRVARAFAVNGGDGPGAFARSGDFVAAMPGADLVQRLRGSDAIQPDQPVLTKEQLAAIETVLESFAAR